MKKQGKIVRWDSTRAFGFIRSPETSADIFFHIRDFQGRVTPQEGMAVSFEEIHVGGKGPRAMAVNTLDASFSRPALAANALPRHRAGSTQAFTTSTPHRRSGPAAKFFLYENAISK